MSPCARFGSVSLPPRLAAPVSALRAVSATMKCRAISGMNMALRILIRRAGSPTFSCVGGSTGSRHQSARASKQDA